jgi:hypothetical protein
MVLNELLRGESDRHAIERQLFDGFNGYPLKKFIQKFCRRSVSGWISFKKLLTVNVGADPIQKN